MAAIRTGLTPSHLATCLLRKTGTLNRGCHPVSDIWSHRLLQRSLLHTVSKSHSPVVRPFLCHRYRGKFLWVNAVAVRYNSSQIPPEDGTITAPAAPFSLPADSTPIISPPLPQQIPAETVPTTAVETSTSFPLPLDSSSGFGVTDPSLVLTQPATEQVADLAHSAVEVLQAAATEPSLVELGLAAHTPVGLIQNCLEFLHVDLGLPWWGAIVAGTVLARLLMFPITVKSQRMAAKMNNIHPEMQKLNAKLNEAKYSGNTFEFSKASTDLTLFLKKHDVNPIKNFLITLAQVPVFLSFFIGLRQMANLPVPSLQTGGLFWFTDLTIADPYYMMPLIVTGSMFLLIRLGGDAGVRNPSLPSPTVMATGISLIILPFIFNFPTALFVYWTTNNICSVAQVSLLKHPPIREKLRIPVIIKHPPSSKSEFSDFFKNMKKGWNNMKLAQELEERQRRLSGHANLQAGPLRETFPHPIKRPNAPAAAKKKKRPDMEPF
ncbi:mitochondrial inner membrane protein OXA1L isoform X2 [Antennarius striatus]|uniref:mitochondrial inner membrane protein OXA1L isoform X2 n=1 Tax=Antennarius striatus TaxID=241820 RepID=UPI0035B0B01B